MPPPLAVITTNNERALPDAFVRRCLVLRLQLPDANTESVRRSLTGRGSRHFPVAVPGVLEAAAEQLAKDRRHARDHRQLPLPGQSQYLDLLRAVTMLETDPEVQSKRVTTLARYTFRKHPQASGSAEKSRAACGRDDLMPRLAIGDADDLGRLLRVFAYEPLTEVAD